MLSDAIDDRARGSTSFHDLMLHVTRNAPQRHHPGERPIDGHTIGMCFCGQDGTNTRGDIA